MLHLNKIGVKMDAFGIASYKNMGRMLESCHPKM